MSATERRQMPTLMADERGRHAKSAKSAKSAGGAKSAKSAACRHGSPPLTCGCQQSRQCRHPYKTKIGFLSFFLCIFMVSQAATRGDGGTGVPKPPTLPTKVSTAVTPCVWSRHLSAVIAALWVHATNAAVERLYRGVDAP